jgi:hypothetical protein
MRVETQKSIVRCDSSAARDGWYVLNTATRRVYSTTFLPTEERAQ